MADYLTTVKGLTLHKSPWMPLAGEYLARIDHECPVEFYRDEVQTGRATLLFVKTPDDSVVAAVVVRIDDTASGPEFVVVAAGGECAGRLMTLDVLPTLETFAKGLGCVCVRAHTRRHAVMAGFGRAGYHIDEFVLKKAV